MRGIRWAALAVLGLVACDSGVEFIPVELRWIEWPAEVGAGAGFFTRLVGYEPTCYQRLELHVPVQVDQSAVTFAPFFEAEGHGQVCPLFEAAGAETAMPAAIGYFDRSIAVRGLPADYDRTYEIRGPAFVVAPATPGGTAPTQRTFGEVTVRVGVPDRARTNVAGQAYQMGPDGLGCVRLLSPVAGYVVENPADTLYHYAFFVRGYLHPVAPALCGETVAFHLLTWN